MKSLLLAFVFTVFQPNIQANTTDYLITELENLRDQLNIEDPKKMDLTLRLADLYFDTSIKESNKELTGKSRDEFLEKNKKQRLRALDLYYESLAKMKPGPEVKGEARIQEFELGRVKIQFQIARLLSRLDEGKKAETHYQEIIKNPKAPKKFIEQSALALAEWYEEETKYSDAKKFYDLAISKCEDRNSCNYGNYRLAWLLFKDTKLNEAILTMEKSLWTKEGIVRENSLTDYIMFLSNQNTDGLKELSKIKEISAIAKRNDLVRSMAESFYVAGNRLAGSNLLKELNKSDPNLYYEVRLLEEFYGFRKWDDVDSLISNLEKRTIADIPQKTEEKKEVLTILRRFIVQVDAEMQMSKKLDVYLKRSINVYLNLYPNDELRKKMQEGWLSAETDNSQKIVKLSKWIEEDKKFGFPEEDIRKLRQTRLSLAQKEKQSKLIVEDALKIAEFLKGSDEADEFQYVAAREMYQENKINDALLIFKSLVKLDSKKKISNWAILSQNITLDIFNQQKNYTEIIAQSEKFIGLANSENLSDDLKKELASVNGILLQAKFEKAANEKNEVVALESFYAFCMQDKFSDKACPNAKVLAVKLKDQEKLVQILTKTSDLKSLAVELELMGRFAEAAKLVESQELTIKPTYESMLKVATLFELEQDFVNRDRILKKIHDQLKKEKVINSSLEKALFVSLEDANMLDESSFVIPWSSGLKVKLASYLELTRPSKKSRDMILSSKNAEGPLWSRAVLSNVETEYVKVNQIKFYGSQSKSLFKKRTDALEKFASLAKGYLDGADLETRVYLLHMLKMSYKNIANEVLNTPIPEGLDEATLTEVAQKISQMADPFDRVNEDYDRLLTEQVAQITNAELKAKVETNLKGNSDKYSPFIAVLSLEQKGNNIDYSELKDLRAKLNLNPEDSKALSELKSFYTNKKQWRLAQYFTGRIENLKSAE